MTLPLIIAEGLDLSTYSAVDDALDALEPIDVRAGIYKGYDAEGRLLKLSCDSGHVTIEVAERHPTHAEELRTLLLKYLVHIGQSPQSDSPSLSELVDATHSFARFKRPRSVWAVVWALFRR